MSHFKCPHCNFDPGAHAWSGLALTRHKWEEHQVPGMASFNFKRLYFPDQETYEKSLRKAELNPVLSLLKQLAKGSNNNFDLSKSQLFWFTLSIGLLLGYILAILFQR